MFWGKSFGKKAGAIVKAWVENTAIFSVLEQVVSQEGLKHCFNMGGKHCNLQCFGASRLARLCKPLPLKWVGNTAIYSVLEQVVWQEGLKHCFNMGGKHCNLQCFGANRLARLCKPLPSNG